ncbi:MAG: hypothetical protein QXR42_01720 [Candidatus Bathyarchaeia archaeon]
MTYLAISKIKKLFKTIHNMFVVLDIVLHNAVLGFFRSLNRTVNSRLRVWYMKKETVEHLRMLSKVFKFIILPMVILYGFALFYYFGENPINSLVWNVLIFLYSNFLPDLPSAYINRKNKGEIEPIKWHKKYALLLFAPVFIWLLFSGVFLRWRTTETFHNFRSLTVYSLFLIGLGFVIFGNFPLSIGNLPKILSLSLFGSLGYLTHLKVDGVW